MRVFLHLITLALFTACAAVAFSREPAAEPAISAERLVADLGDAEWSTRERSMLTLMERPDVDDSLLAAGFRTARSPEQVHRLTLIALHRFYAQLGRDLPPPDPDGKEEADTAGVGVDLSHGMSQIVQPHENLQLRDLGTPAVVINGAMPGFPAFTRLRPGDLVVALDGEPFKENLDVNAFIDAIKKHPPGTPMIFRVLRDAAVIDVELVTDSKRRLVAVFGEMPKDVAWALSQPKFQEHLASLQGVRDEARIRIDLEPPPGPEATGS